MRLKRGKLNTNTGETFPASYLNCTAPHQPYFMVGIPATFLAQLTMATNDASYIDTASAILEWLTTCSEDLYASPLAIHIALAAASVAKITGSEHLAMLGEQIVAHILTQQNSDGSFQLPPFFSPESVYPLNGEYSLMLRMIDGK